MVDHPGHLGPWGDAIRHLLCPHAQLDQQPALPKVRTSPLENGSKARIGCSALGSRVKSGQITPLKMSVRTQYLERGLQGVDADRRRIHTAARHAVGHEASGQHMVEVRVADEDVVDLCQLVEPEQPRRRIEVALSTGRGRPLSLFRVE